MLAEQAGYYDELCLDVELTSSFSTANYPLVAGGEAEIASGGSFSEVVDFATANDVELVAVDVEGRVGDRQPDRQARHGRRRSRTSRGTTIGVKGKLPPSIAAMLAGAGLVEGTDFETVLLDGFDPIAHYNLDGIVGFPGYKSNEPGQLERAGLPFELFDPTEFDVPGSFGVLFTTREWAEANPTALQDFLRATMKGLADAAADPAAATVTAFAAIEAGGNPNFLSEEGRVVPLDDRGRTPPGAGGRRSLRRAHPRRAPGRGRRLRRRRPLRGHRAGRCAVRPRRPDRRRLRRRRCGHLAGLMPTSAV